MTALITRASKGSQLTWDDVDGNWDDLATISRYAH